MMPGDNRKLTPRRKVAMREIAFPLRLVEAIAERMPERTVIARFGGKRPIAPELRNHFQRESEEIRAVYLEDKSAFEKEETALSYSKKLKRLKAALFNFCEINQYDYVFELTNREKIEIKSHNVLHELTEIQTFEFFNLIKADLENIKTSVALLDSLADHAIKETGLEINRPSERRPGLKAAIARVFDVAAYWKGRCDLSARDFNDLCYGLWITADLPIPGSTKAGTASREAVIKLMKLHENRSEKSDDQ